MPEVVVLALGHPARSDDGFGERLLQRFEQQYRGADGLQCLHGGTRPMAHYDRIAGCRWLILLDAVRHDGVGAAVIVADPLPEPDRAGRLAVHELGIAEMLQLMQVLDDLPSRVSLVGAPFHSLDWGRALSLEMERYLPQACDALVRLLGNGGVRLQQRSRVEVGDA